MFERRAEDDAVQPRSATRRLRIVALTLVAIASTACASPASLKPSVPVVAETPSPGEAEAIRFRTEFGLRADQAYVRHVAVDPAASNVGFGLPLLPAEIAELNARAANADAIRDVIRAYASGQATEFGGLYLDQARGGVLTTLWTANLEQHAAAIRALVRPDARIAFRPARFTYNELLAWQDRIDGDTDWMPAAGIAPTGAGVDVIGNRLEIDVSSADPNAAALVIAHYPAPLGMLFVKSDGTGAALIRFGTVRGRALDVDGQPPGDRLAGELILQWTSDGPGDCGRGDIGFGLSGDGSFEVPCQAGGHTIEVQIGVPNDGWRTIGSGHVVAVADGVVGLTIRLDGPWPAPTMQ